MPTELHIGIDAEKIVVTPYAVRMRTGRVRRYRTGSLVEGVPVRPSGRGREDRLTTAARLGLPLLFACAALYAAGVPWWLSAAASAATVVTVWRRQARAAQRGVFEVPSGDDARVLRSAGERAAFGSAVAAAHRVRRTWPGLSSMIDPVIADRALNHALDDLATILVRRQEIRRLRTSLAGVRHQDVPGDSPAVRALTEQRERTEELWHEAGEQADRILASLEATARAGETFLHERRISETARQAELVLAGLTAAVPTAGTGPDLADRTAAVISAYRDLAAAGQS
jgi:hypothetical protein